MTKLFLCEFTLRVSTYMNDDEHRETYTRLVRANNEDDARAIIEARTEFKTDEYAVYRRVRSFEAHEVIEAEATTPDAGERGSSPIGQNDQPGLG